MQTAFVFRNKHVKLGKTAAEMAIFYIPLVFIKFVDPVAPNRKADLTQQDLNTQYSINYRIMYTFISHFLNQML